MSCLSCESEITQFLDLGTMAYANAFLDSANQLEERTPLKVGFCPKCYLVQLMEDSRVNPEKLFKNYTYFTSTSPQLHRHFEDYADEILVRLPEVKHKLVVEIASNDGLLLKNLMGCGVENVVGVEPAKNVAEEAVKVRNVPTFCNFFDNFTAKKIEHIYGKAKLIIANNVLAHTPNPKGMLKAAYDLLTDDGVFVCEVQHVKELIEKNEWTNIYHEHYSYYSFTSLEKLVKSCGFYIFDLSCVDTQGGSLRVWCRKSNSVSELTLISFWHMEQEVGLGKLQTYQYFAKQVEKIKIQLNELLASIKSQGKKIVGYGAPAKGNTLLQYCGIGSRTLDYITDEAPSKQDKCTPGTHIPVVPRNYLFATKPDYVLLLAWNYAKSIIDRESWIYDHGGKFINIVPEPHIVDLNAYDGPEL